MHYEGEFERRRNVETMITEEGELRGMKASEGGERKGMTICEEGEK